MMRIIDKSGHERLEPDSYILQDGETYRVPMKFTDAAGTNSCNLTDAQVKRYCDAYDKYLDYINNAWRRNHDPVRPPKQQQPPSHSHPIPMMDARESAYRAYCDRISNAWKGARV